MTLLQIIEARHTDLQGYLFLAIKANHKVAANDQKAFTIACPESKLLVYGTPRDLDPISFWSQLTMFEGIVQHFRSSIYHWETEEAMSAFGDPIFSANKFCAGKFESGTGLLYCFTRLFGSLKNWNKLNILRAAFFVKYETYLKGEMISLSFHFSRFSRIANFERHADIFITRTAVHFYEYVISEQRPRKCCPNTRRAKKTQ